MNLVVLAGRLTADPQINDKVTCASFNLAVERKFKKEGDQTADFISCKMLGDKRADFASKYLKKGTKVIVTGSIQTGSYTKQDGTKVYTTDVIVDSTEFSESIGNQQNNPKPAPDNSFMDIPNDAEDLPFN